MPAGVTAAIALCLVSHHTKIALESPLYDALYAFCLQQAAQESTS
jgi:hypothetical protein